MQDLIADSGEIDARLIADQRAERFCESTVDDPGCDWRLGVGTTVPVSSLLVDCAVGGRRS